jgi:hypothetical protein
MSKDIALPTELLCLIKEWDIFGSHAFTDAGEAFGNRAKVEDNPGTKRLLNGVLLAQEMSVAIRAQRKEYITFSVRPQSLIVFGSLSISISAFRRSAVSDMSGGSNN